MAAYTIGIARLNSQAPGHKVLLAMLLCNRSVVLVRLHSLDAAVVDARQAVALRPEFARARCQLGVVLLCAGRCEDAYLEFARALLLEPNSAAAKRGRDACL